MPSSPALDSTLEHTISKIFYCDLASEDGIALSSWVEYQGLHVIIDFLIWYRSYAFQHKEGSYAYGKNTDGVTLSLIMVLKSPCYVLTRDIYLVLNSRQSFFMENWKLKTFSHLAQFSQEFYILVLEIGHQNIINHITSSILKQ